MNGIEDWWKSLWSSNESGWSFYGIIMGEFGGLQTSWNETRIEGISWRLGSIIFMAHQRFRGRNKFLEEFVGLFGHFQEIWCLRWFQLSTQFDGLVKNSIEVEERELRLFYQLTDLGPRRNSFKQPTIYLVEFAAQFLVSKEWIEMFKES